MPVANNAVLRLMESQTDWVDSAIQHIDSKLSDANYVKNMVYNKDVNPTYKFGIPGTATEDDKARIKFLYRSVGWKHVKVQNSAENGERPGMVGVDLFTFVPEEL